MASGRTASRAAALFAAASLAPCALADDVFWAGNQGCGGEVERGSWFDSANWFGFSVPGASDRAILEEPPGSVRPPYIIHFGNFGKCPSGCGEEMIAGGDAVLANLEVNHRDWLFDFGSGMEGACGIPPSPLAGSLTVSGSTVVGPDTRSASLTLANGSLITGVLHVGVGNAPTVGELVVSGEAAVLDVLTTHDNINIGHLPGNTGTLDLADGAHATFRSGVFVGRDGADGSMHLASASTVHAISDMYIGSGVATGALTVEDDSLLKWERALAIGHNAGDGQLDVNGASLSAESGERGWLLIGQGAEASGSVTVSASTVDAAQLMIIGDGGTATAVIEQGASVSADNIAIGQASGTGDAIVRGAGTVLQGLWAVGSSGVGSLRAEAGGAISSRRADGGRHYVFVGEASGARGAVHIDGAGSIWTDIEELNLGGVWHTDTNGDGSLSVTGGGRVSCGIVFAAAYYPANQGRIEVRGAGSSLQIERELILGRPGQGALTLADGGEVTCAGATFGPGAACRVEVSPTGAGALAASGPITVNGALEVALAPGFEPAPGQEYTIITAGSLAGDFATIDAPGFRVRTSASALRVTFCPCRADMDCSGDLSFFDFLAFQDFFAAGDPIADIDGDGDLTFFDFLAFQNDFASGCP